MMIRIKVQRHMLLSHYATAGTQLFIEDCNALVVEGKELLQLPTHFCDRFAFIVGRRTRMAGLEILLGNICSAQYAMCSVLLIYHLYRLQRLQISEVTSCAYPIQLARFSGIEQSTNPF